MSKDNAKCDHCGLTIFAYKDNKHAWWCKQCITEHGRVLPQFGLSDPGRTTLEGLHWGSDSNKLRSVPKYDNIVL